MFERLNKNVCSTIDLSARRSAQMGIKMKKKKEIILSVAVCLAAVAYIVYNTVGAPMENKDIISFLVVTMAVPAIVSFICGILLGRKKTLKQMFPMASVIVAIMFGISVFSMLYSYRTGMVFEMLDNTVTSGNIQLNINESVTFGTVVQQALILIVCVCIGSGIRNKAATVLSRVKN